jgi:hypothetical protein
MKGVQASGEVPEENLDDVVSEQVFKRLPMTHVEIHKLEKVREERDRQYIEEQKSGKKDGTKVRDSAASLAVAIADPTAH